MQNSCDSFTNKIFGLDVYVIGFCLLRWMETEVAMAVKATYLLLQEVAY